MKRQKTGRHYLSACLYFKNKIEFDKITDAKEKK